MPMTRGANGVWSVNFGPVEPGVYRYSFSVDGVQTTDPRNPEASESLTSVRSLYEVPGADFLEYKPGVAHGAIASVGITQNAAAHAPDARLYASWV